MSFVSRFFSAGMVLAVAPCAEAAAQLWINEVVALNTNSATDERGEAADWIEVYNAGTSAVDLAGYYLSDDPAAPLDYAVPAGSPDATTVAPGDFLILWADEDIADGANHLDFKLSADGESVVLTAPDGVTLVDEVAFGPLGRDVAFGRTPDGGAALSELAAPTPGAANTSGPRGVAPDAPVASVRGGFHDGGVAVALTSTTPDAAIRYTTDGSVPDEADALYVAPITIQTNTPLRARSFAPGAPSSAVTTSTYLFDAPSTIAVVAYTADPIELFDSLAGGMYPNYDQDIEIVVNVELYEPDGRLGFNQQFESGVQGSGSAQYLQKSLSLTPRARLGSSTVDYAVFPESSRDQYRSLALRNSGQDNRIVHFRDAFATSLAINVDDLRVSDGEGETRKVISDPKINGMRSRPVLVYLNGRPWGVYNLRERADRRYLRTHFGLGDGEVDFIEDDNGPLDIVREGDSLAHARLKRFIEANSLEADEDFAVVADQLDVKEYADYIALNVYLDNQDWPGNNGRRFRERRDGAKWHHLSYDFDFTFGLFVPGQEWNSGYNQTNSLLRLLTLDNSLNAYPNPAASTLLPRRMFENATWRREFANRFADQLNLVYSDERVEARLNAYADVYAPEMPRQFDRWGFISWAQNLDRVREFATGRAEAVRGHVVAQIPEVTGTNVVDVTIAGGEGGEVDFNTVRMSPAYPDYTGTYFTGIDIPVVARALPGYVFAGWSGSLSGDDFETVLRLDPNTTAPAALVATFTAVTSSNTGVVINEINYNSPDEPNPEDWIELHNATGAAVDLSGWRFADDSGDAFPLPNGTSLPAGGFLVVARNQPDFEAVYPGVGPVVGSFGNYGGTDSIGFRLSGSGEALTLLDAGGGIVDQVTYSDQAPWPLAADGEGPTLQLLDPALDNTLATSWGAAVATPAATNVVTSDIEAPAVGGALGLYPNPASTSVAVEWVGAEVVRVRVYDAAGRLSADRSPRAPGSAYALSLNGLTPGVYSVQCTRSTGEVATQRLVVTP